MTFHTDVSTINISYIYGEEAAALMASCMDMENEDVTLDGDTLDEDPPDDEATVVYVRPRGRRAAAGGESGLQ